MKIFLHINNIEHVYFNKLQFDMKIMRIDKKCTKIFYVQVYEIFVKDIMLYKFPEKNITSNKSLELTIITSRRPLVLNFFQNAALLHSKVEQNAVIAALVLCYNHFYLPYVGVLVSRPLFWQNSTDPCPKPQSLFNF